MIKNKIFAVGELLFDVYPEHKKLGGAPFNFIYHVWKLTGKGIFFSQIGDDENGKAVVEKLTSLNFNTEYIDIDEHHPTGAVKVKLDKDGTPDFNIKTNTAYDYLRAERLQEAFKINSIDLAYFGTLAQRNEISRKTIQSMWNKDVKYFCDVNLRQNFYTREILYDSLMNSNIVKVNNDELKLISKMFLTGSSTGSQSAVKLKNKFNIELLCVTMGSEGSYILRNGEKSMFSYKIDNIIDTVGAGDAFSSILAVGYLLNWEISKINKLASEFAADICTIDGAIPAEDKFYSKYSRVINEE